MDDLKVKRKYLSNFDYPHESGVVPVALCQAGGLHLGKLLPDCRAVVDCSWFMPEVAAESVLCYWTLANSDNGANDLFDRVSNRTIVF